jgi:RNA-directed DNA polymerase
VKSIQEEKKPETVPKGAKQAGDTLEKWNWVEPKVWTERMLATLETGVKGGKWFSLIDKVCAGRNLKRAYEKVRKNRGGAGVDRVTIRQFEKQLERNIEKLERSLKEGEYQPQKIRRVYIPKPGSKEKRGLGIPTVRDRVVQASVRQTIEPIFEREFSNNSYGFRPGRSCKKALRRVDEAMKEGKECVVEVDIKRYFDRIPHDKLMERVKERVADGRTLQMIESFLGQGVMEGMEEWNPEEGTPQGAVISPLLANIYLNPLDQQMEAEGYEMIRYADDFVVMCRSEAEAKKALKRIQVWTREAGLELHEEKTRIIDMRQAGNGIDFLGYHFERSRRTGRMNRWPRKKSLKKFKDTIRAKTKRCNGRSLEGIIKTINPVLRGWFGYFKQSYKGVFIRTDGWIRMRLRSILRKRAGKRGRGRGCDHQKWKNAYFTERGLYSLTAAYETVANPL